mgnify:FL=1
MTYEAKIEAMRSLTEAALEQYVQPEKLPQKTIYEAMRYSLLSGGKRLRPILMLLSCEACGGHAEDAVPFACALEMVHTYSLIHDDLPAMDNDELRRGMPTNHVKFGEAMAILAGDALLNRAFEIASSKSSIPADRTVAAIRILSEASGAYGMIGGQVIDIESENKAITAEELKHLHALKTGAIIRAAGKMGAVIAGAEQKKMDALDAFCLNLGIAFQIQDDILDVTGTEETLGKPIGSDAENGKTTYITLYGKERAGELSEEYTKRAVDALSVFGEEKKYLVALAEHLTNRRK